MPEKVTIAVDALGADAKESVVLPGIARALATDPDLEILVVGPEDIVTDFCAHHERAHACVATEEITMAEHPAAAIRKKKDASIVVAARQVADGAADGFFSGGSTGACLAAATLIMGRIKGVARPTLCTVVPSPVRPSVLCDVGANADAKPEYLVQFAQMAEIYARTMLGREHPRIALLNIGEEEEKGSAFAQSAHALLKEHIPAFVGNAEGRDIVAGTFDVVVTDGFTGNVCLKTIEGTAKSLMNVLKDTFMSSAKGKMGALLVKDSLKSLKNSLSPDEMGGAPLLGVRGACVIGHGSSNEIAIANGIAMCAKTVRMHVSDLISQSITPESK